MKKNGFLDDLRSSGGENGDSAAVYFFSNEITALTDLFVKYVNLREIPERDYYAEK